MTRGDKFFEKFLLVWSHAEKPEVTKEEFMAVCQHVKTYASLPVRTDAEDPSAHKLNDFADSDGEQDDEPEDPKEESAKPRQARKDPRTVQPHPSATRLS